MSAGKGTRVTAEDLGSGAVKASVIHDDYILVTDGDCHLAGVQKHEDGTHVITVRNAGGAR